MSEDHRSRSSADGAEQPKPPGHDATEAGESSRTAPRADVPPGISRRGFLLATTAAAGGLMLGGLATAGCTDDSEVSTDTSAGATETTGQAMDMGGDGTSTTLALSALTVGEAQTLQAVLARLIPSDDVGPGATEAGVVRYIDRALSSELAADLDVTRYNLARLDEYARESGDQNVTFNGLNPDDQDQLIASLEGDEAEGFVPSAAAFFATTRELALQGMFGDPFYGGNIDNVGWDLIGFPGIRLLVEAGDQDLGAEQSEGRSSVYDFDMFGLEQQEG